MTEARKKRILKILIYLTITVIVLIAYAIQSRQARLDIPDGSLRMFFFDVGQADATLVIAPNGENLLIDTGDTQSADRLLQELSRVGVDHLDYLLLSHGHEDHMGGAAAVLRELEVEHILLPGEKFASSATYSKTIAAIDREGATVWYGDSTDEAYSFPLGEVTVSIFPSPLYGGAGNNDSLIVRTDYREISCLFCGDAEKKEEEALLKRYGADAFDTDLIKVGHHGSSSSTCSSWLDAVTPDTAVISCGVANSYGHPHRETLQRLREEGVYLLRTDELGTITIWSDGYRLVLYE